MYHSCKEALSILSNVSMQNKYQSALQSSRDNWQFPKMVFSATLKGNSKLSKPPPPLPVTNSSRSNSQASSSFSRQSNANSKMEFSLPTQGTEKVSEKMKSLLNSKSPIIYVNRVPLSMLSSFGSARSMSEHFVSTSLKNENLSFRSGIVDVNDKSERINVPHRNSISKNDSRDEPKSLNSGASRESSSPYHKSTAHDLASLKKMAITEIQKSRQYLKIISNHLRSKIQYSSGMFRTLN